MILTGDKIRIRSLGQKDVLFIIKWNFHPKLLKWITDPRSLDVKINKASRAKIENLAKRMRKNRKIFIIEVKDNGHWESIGECELSGLDRDKQNGNAIFSIYLIPDRWRRGYGTKATKLLLSYAFEKMCLHRIESHVSEFNTQSIAFHKKFGFIEEGRQKEALFRNGKFCDRIIFRLIETEWEGLKKRQNIE